MAKRLTDVQVSEIARLAAAGMKQSEIASMFGVTQSAVSRIVSGQRRGSTGDGEPGAVAVALDVYLAELAPEGANVVLAEMARAAAVKVDSCRSTATVGAAQAMPRLVGELRDLL